MSELELVDVLWEAEARPEGDALVERLRRRAALALAATEGRGRELSLVLTDDPAIRALNAQWRGQDKPTDVLSFPLDESAEGVDGPVPELEGGPLGDIVISLDTAARQAAEHGLSLDEELTFLLVHGLCHLLGHDHGAPDEAASMRLEEDRLLALASPGTPRPPTPY